MVGSNGWMVSWVVLLVKAWLLFWGCLVVGEVIKLDVAWLFEFEVPWVMGLYWLHEMLLE